MKARIYIRVSTDEQVEGYSLEVQEERCRAYITSQGWEVEGVTSDSGYSGYYTDRPGLSQLISDAKEKKFDVVVVYKLDRFSRKLQDLLNIASQMEAYSIALKSVTEPFDTITSHGRLQFQILGSFAEFERNRIKERIFPGMIKGVMRGHWQGARYAPYGYRYNKSNKKLEIIPEESEVVKEIFKMSAQGFSSAKIARSLYNSGIVSRNHKPFQSVAIIRILRNPIYTGKIVWNRCGYRKDIKVGKTYKYVCKPQEEWIIGEGAHAPIVSELEFEYVQALLDKKADALRKRGFLSSGASGRQRRLDSDHILSGILFCDCGKAMYGDRVISNHRKKIYKRRYLCCSRTTYHVPCGNKTVYAENVEPKITEIIGKITHSPRFLDHLIKFLHENLIEDDPIIASQIRHCKAQYEINRKKLEKLVYEIIDPLNNIDHSIITKVINEINEEQKILENRIKELKDKVAPIVYKEAIDRFIEMLKDFNMLWGKFTNEEKKGFLRLIIKKIVMKDGKIKENILLGTL